MDRDAAQTQRDVSHREEVMACENRKKSTYAWIHTGMYAFSFSYSFPRVCVYVCTYTYACKLLPPPPLQSCPTLCDPTDGSPPGSTIPGILQARTLEWVAISFSNICICMYLQLSHFAGHQKLRHSELIVLQFKTKKREEVEVQNGRKK